VEVVVHALDVAGIDPGDVAALTELLDSRERARAARFAFEEDRRAYVAAHALLRVRLSEHLGGAPQDWRFAAAAHGKPFLLDAPHDLRFSLTHARDMVAVALCEGADIGVDVEPANRRAESLKLAERFFAPQEATYLRSLEGDARCEAFFAIWTVKEAVVKATGLGLAGGLDGFAISLDPLTLTPRDASEPSTEWRLAHWRPGAHHVALAGQAADWRPRLVETSSLSLPR
jgi:4'-phosphopantetheinyl transferase